MLHLTINKVTQLQKKAILHWHGTQNTERDRGGSGGHAFLTFFLHLHSSACNINYLTQALTALASHYKNLQA